MPAVTNEEVVTKIRSWKGRHEDPMGSNSGQFVEECQHSTWLPGTGWPWCAATVCHLCEWLGIPLTGANSAGAHDLADRHKANWVTDRSKWRPGMVVDYNIGSGHTGTITSLGRLKAGYVTSTDGNWADAVTEHEMPVSEIRAVWRIPGVDYGDGPAPKPAPSKPPKWVVTTGASGHKVVFRRKKGLIHFLQTHTFKHGITIKRAKKR